MLDAELYTRMLLESLEDPRLTERAHAILDLENTRPRKPGAVRRFLAPRLMALGSRLERAGASLAIEPQPGE